MRKVKTYLDTLVTDKEFKERFDREYQNLCIAEHIVRTRKVANLTREK